MKAILMRSVLALCAAYATCREPIGPVQFGGVAFMLAGIGIELLHPIRNPKLTLIWSDTHAQTTQNAQRFFGLR